MQRLAGARTIVKFPLMVRITFGNAGLYAFGAVMRFLD